MTLKEFREKSCGIEDMTIWYDNEIVKFEDFKDYEIEEFDFDEYKCGVVVDIYLKNK